MLLRLVTCILSSYDIFKAVYYLYFTDEAQLRLSTWLYISWEQIIFFLSQGSACIVYWINSWLAQGRTLLWKGDEQVDEIVDISHLSLI